MRFHALTAIFLAAIAIEGAAQETPRPGDKRAYVDFAMRNDGDVSRGKQLFANEERVGCTKCHTVDGTASKAGPDLAFVGDKFPRRELIRSVMEPSVAIAIGYGTTILETKDGEEFSGIIKQATGAFIELMGGDGKSVRVATSNIESQRDSAVSLMPEGLESGLTPHDFADLVEYLVTLKQADNTLSANRGMPSQIEPLANPVGVRPFFTEEMRFPHAFVHKPGDVRSGLVWFGQLPGASNTFVVVHQTGKIWLVDKRNNGDVKTLFADVATEIFNERGPNGLLSIAFHPKFRENRRYFLKHQVFEGGKIATVLDEREASPDLRHDSGKPARRLLKIVSVTQDHSGGCIAFGPDGFLYLGMGDTGPQQDPQGHGQDLQTLLGKMLRIDVDRQDGGLPYGIPMDNPYRVRSDARPEIWALGFREPWRFSFDSLTGNLWVGDVGQDRVEEVSIVRRGENHGWNVFEGFEPFSNRYRKEGVSYVAPVFAYKRKYGNSITGGFVYRGDKHSSFYGVYICGDYTSKRIFGVTQENRVLKTVRQIGESPQFIASFGTDQEGNIYVVGYEGMIYRIDFNTTSFDSNTDGPHTTTGTHSR